MLLATPAASAVPSTVTTSPYRLATPLRGTPLAGPRPRPHAPASGLGAGPGLRVQPRAPSLCALPGARAIRGPAPARLQRALPSHGAGAVLVPTTVCTSAGRGERDTERDAALAAMGLGKARRRSQSAAFHGLQGGAQELGPVPRARAPDRLRPGLPKTPSSCGTALADRGWHHPGAGSGRPCPSSHWTAARSKLSAHVAWPPEVAAA